MKKFAKIIPVILILCLLSGCYTSDTTIKFNQDESVSFDTTFMSTEAMYRTLSGFSTTSFIDQQIADLKNQFSETGTQPLKDFSIEAVYPEGKPAETEDPAPTEGTDGEAAPKVEYDNEKMNGFKVHATYSSFDEFTTQTSLFSVTAPNLLVRKYNKNNESAKNIIDVEKRTSLFGTRYIGTGTMELIGDMNVYYDAMSENLKSGLKNAYKEVTFKFPLSVVKSNAPSKGFLGSAPTWKVTGNEGEETAEVSFDAFVINPIIFAETLIILILLILLFVHLLKKKGSDVNEQKPDEYYTDEEGNVIPVYYDEDSEDDDFEEVLEEIEDSIVETEEAEAEETEIIPQDDENDNE